MNRKKLFISIILSMLILSGCTKEGETSIKDNKVVVFYDGRAYSGTYKGEKTKNGIANGEGVFKTDEESEEKFTITGTWKKGELRGKTTITLENGTTIEVKYKNNKPKGSAITTYPDGSHAKYRYYNHIPGGKIVFFDKNDKVIGTDYFHQGKTTEEWKSLAKKIDYIEYFKNPEKYFMEPVQFEGKVVDILDSSNTTYVLVENRKKEHYIFYYKNEKERREQALVPNLRKGDNITGYGFFRKCGVLNLDKLNPSTCILDSPVEERRLSNYVVKTEKEMEASYIQNNAWYSTLPCISGICVEVKNKNTIHTNKMNMEQAEEYNYESVARNPYFYSGFLLKDQVEIIQQDIDYKTGKIQMLLKRTKNQKSELYYADYNINEGEKLVVKGDTIMFEATIEGNYKLEQVQEMEGYLEKEYLIIPKITIENILQ